MDEMQIRSRLVNGLLGKLIERLISNKLGYNMEIKLNEINASVVNNQAKIHLDADVNLSEKDIKKLLKGTLGINMEEL